MGLIRTGLVLAAVVMVLPVDERSQSELTASASRAVGQTATYCERNPVTCATGRDAWALFLRKAEYAVELAARLAREQLARALAPPQPEPAAAANAPQRPETPAPRRNQYTMDHPSRWR